MAASDDIELSGGGVIGLGVSDCVKTEFDCFSFSAEFCVWISKVVSGEGFSIELIFGRVRSRDFDLDDAIGQFDELVSG